MSKSAVINFPRSRDEPTSQARYMLAVRSGSSRGPHALFGCRFRRAVPLQPRIYVVTGDDRCLYKIKAVVHKLLNGYFALGQFDGIHHHEPRVTVWALHDVNPEHAALLDLIESLRCPVESQH